MTTTRCNAEQRKAFEGMRVNTGYGTVLRCSEPALGTLSERLDIIIRRLGGRTGPLRLEAAERNDFHASRGAA